MSRCLSIWGTRAVALGGIVLLSGVACVEPPALRLPPAPPSAPGVPPASAGTASPSPAADPNRIVQEGIVVELSVTPVTAPQEGLPASAPRTEIREGDDVLVTLRITDETTGAPATRLEPAAWIHPSSPEVDCKEKIASFLTGSLSARAEVDLNIYYVLSLNEDASISVVDPLFGYGGSKLLAMPQLRSPGEDWVLGPDSTRLFVTMPQRNQVAVVDTRSWKVIAEIDAGERPCRIALGPGENFVWVGSDGASPLDLTSGVTVIDARSLEKVTTIPTGLGHHELAVSDDHQRVWVTNSEAGSVSVFDAQSLKKLKEIDTGRRAVSVAYSPLSQAAYVVSAEDGLITIIDGSSLEVMGKAQAEPGLGALRFAPGGRFGFVVNPTRDLIHILDASSGRIVQTADVEKRPDQVTFTESLAYVRSLDSEIVLMIPLAGIGQEGAPVPLVDFPAGQAPLGDGPPPSSADGIVPAPGGASVLVANGADGAIYYYREGMAAPMGSFQCYGRQPRAVLVVDRSLNEVEPGVYATTARLDLKGKLDLALFLPSPRITHCFSFDVAPNPGRPERIRGPNIQVDWVLEGSAFRAGEATQVQLRVTDPKTTEALDGIEDLCVLATSSGTWQQRGVARPLGKGLYEVEVTAPVPGTYFLSFQCASRSLRLNEMPPLMVRVAGQGGRHE